MGCCVPPKQTPEPAMTVTDEVENTRVLRSSTRETRTFKLTFGDFIKVNTSRIIDEYTLGDVLGSGSFGEVRVGVHKATGSERAVKMIILGDNSSQEELDKLLKEVSILKALDHPNIIRIFEVYKNNNKLYIITELCRGGELFDRIKSMKKFGENQAAKYMLDIVSAVMHCHDCDIIHRDLKPENLLFESEAEDSKLKLIDFGTSRFMPQDKKLKKAIGTCYYIAPEVLTGEYDKKVDVWSLGVILYIMLSGGTPFSGRTDDEIFAKIKSAPLSFHNITWETVSDEAKFLIRKMLEKKTTQRYTIEQVFNDPWLQSRGMSKVPDKLIEAESLRTLASFRTQSTLQKAVFSYIISQFVDKKHFEMLRDVFMSFDKNGDGFLSREEIRNAVSEFEFHINIDEVLSNCDTDRNGYINYSEFLTATVNKVEAYSKKHLSIAFKRFDKNNDGKIDIEELKAALGGKNSDSVVRTMIEEADTNQDGCIDFDEFLLHMNKQMN